MRALLQRVTRASVTVEGERISEIGRGFLILLGVTQEDTAEDGAFLAGKIANLRVFEEDRLMVETQRPERLPLDLTLEAHIPADRSSIAYRRGLQKMGFGDFFLV